MASTSSTSSAPLPQTAKIVIIGAGTFGLSTAWHLLQRGYADVTVLERADVVPAPDGASNDFNRVVRSSYPDAFYARFAREAIAEWKKTDVWADSYVESGVILIGNSKASYADRSYENDVASGARLEPLSTPSAIRAAFRVPSTVELPSFETSAGYLNHDGGWAIASQATTMMAEKVRALGGKIFAGKVVEEFVKSDGKTKGVKCKDGTEYEADLVVVASGAWTASAFPELKLQERMSATGQCIAMVQLTPEEAPDYKNVPVYLDFHTGFYAFPPNKDNLLKFAIHHAGLSNLQPTSTGESVSTPRTLLSDGQDGLRIPKESATALRDALKLVYPALARKPFVATRLCWYTDTPDDDFIVGYHPEDSGIFLATAGCGHAYKFLPVIGRLGADIIQGVMPEEHVKKFAVVRDRPEVNNVNTSGSKRKGHQPAPLVLANLAGPDDLQA